MDSTASDFPVSQPVSNRPVWDAAVATLLMLLVAGIGVYYGYTRDYQLQFQTVQADLRRLASVAAEQVDGDMHKELTSPDQMGKEAHLRALRPLVRMHRAVPEITYLYTAILRGNNDYRLILDTTTSAADLDLKRPVQPSPIMEVYEHPTDAMTTALTKGKITATTELYTDRFGTFLSGFAPFRDSNGNVSGVVGVDMDIATFDERIEASRNAWIISAAALTIAALACGYSIYLMRTAQLLAAGARVRGR